MDEENTCEECGKSLEDVTPISLKIEVSVPDASGSREFTFCSYDCQNEYAYGSMIRFMDRATEEASSKSDVF